MGHAEKLSTFIEKANKRHCGKYTYANTVYIDSKTKVTITCPDHGNFEQRPNAHLHGKGCIKCSNNTRFTTEQFIAKAAEVHSGKYSYDRSIYNGARSSVTITCPEHGDFQQKAHVHLRGGGCKQCISSSLRDDNASFREKAVRKHGDTYNYDKVEYGSSQRDPVCITCANHGDFLQLPQHHLLGCGCPKCSFGPSKGELELLATIQSISPAVINSDRSTLGGKELDILVPEKNVAFEYNGLYWHSSRAGKDVMYHQRKSDLAAKANVRLIHIFSDEWLLHRDWCESHIRNVLNAPARIIYGRKCEIVEHATAANVRDFLNENHIQGFRGGRTIALIHAGEIVACAVISKTARGEVELARWCVKLNTRVVGGFNRITKLLPPGIVSFCDTAKYDGTGYLAAGWKLISSGQPSYYYTDGNVRIGRQRFQKHKLLARGAAGSTEVELAASEGFYRIGGCRQLKFQLPIK